MILSFPCNFFVCFKFLSDLGRVIGKIKQNELDCRDTAPLIVFRFLNMAFTILLTVILSDLIKLYSLSFKTKT